MTQPLTRPIHKVLIANRGEIACRVIRTLRDMGRRSVALFSDPDSGSPHVRLADQAHRIGPAPASESYLSIANVVDAAKRTGCDAVMPGYGFLSENTAFAEACRTANLTFIGPSPAVIQVMGSKLAARRLAEQCGVPLVPGGPADTIEQACETARRVGFPVLLKASAGGGGKGMRTLTDERGLTEAFGTAGREAERAFGSSTLYVEKALQAPRHVEIQLLGDRHGNVVHLFERDCSIQRRHQKIIEETPCPALPAETLERMANVALTLAHAVSYDSVGTIEFLLDKGGAFYFLEMNTRLQVEHPISELITGFDLVSEMVRVAEGQPLGYEQATVTRRGAAIECRIYAEDPASGFLPRTGTLVAYREPSGPFVRVDSGVAEGSLIGSHYDPLLAKICTWGANRTEAIARMRRALQETRITGVTTNLELLRAILDEPGFRAGDYDTHTLTRHPELCSRRASPQLTAALASAAHASRTREEQRFRANPITGWASHGRTRRG